MKTALIIDDDERCRAPAAERLRALGWTVVEAENGEQGLELALKHDPDVILCTLLMPNGNGFQLCRAVREQLDSRDTRIVAISTGDYAADHTSALEAGANEVVEKSALLDELEAIIARATASLPATSTREGEHPAVNGARPAEVRFWGVRGSIPTPGPETVRYGGNTSCVEVRADGEIVVLDAGSGIRSLGIALTKEFAKEPLNLTVLITHTHWDHIQGFPFFSPAYNSINRLRILGYEGARAGLGATLAGQMESPYFPIALKEMPGHIVIEELPGMGFEVGAIHVDACFAKHPGVCVGYRLSTSSGTIVYVPDNEWSPEDSVSECAESCNRNAKMIELVKGADILMMDAQYDREEYQAHKGWGHGCVDDVVGLALDAGVKHLYLFHHDPAHDDARIDALLQHAQALVAARPGATLVVRAAREGEAFTFQAKGAST
ncbi:MAG TPA: response regulator [Chthoniobacteraceae bacterium]|jgi:phosphoribosyl 1,2-cyclic phosphodiesterase/ActR/RegA family two-component response regulator|nr:response regulator [Chthoniobacteraceae bacterium]